MSDGYNSYTPPNRHPGGGAVGGVWNDETHGYDPVYSVSDSHRPFDTPHRRHNPVPPYQPQTFLGKFSLRGIRKRAGALLLAAGVAAGTAIPTILKPVYDNVLGGVVERVTGVEPEVIIEEVPTPPVVAEPQQPQVVECTIIRESEPAVITALRDDILDHVTQVCDR